MSGLSVTRVRPAGPSGQRPLRALLLHGLGDAPAVWNALLPHLPAHLDVWTADMPWADPSPYAPLERAAEAIGAVDGGADVVVAHSFAASAVLELLAHDGPDAAGLTAVALVAPFYRPRADDFDWATITYYFEGFHRILEEGVAVRSGDRLPPDILRLMALRMRERVGPYGWLAFFAAYLRTPFLDLRRARLPVLVVGGRHDFAAPPEDGQALAAALPDSVHTVLPDCGHFPMAERPEHFAKVLGEFLSSPTSLEPK
ncbi:MAG: alpha/beta fold hydrolase [Actinomadura rubrobrunea]|nr:alpha/beta fold hydrolase [Actinomadura rubrobrunea]